MCQDGWAEGPVSRPAVVTRLDRPGLTRWGDCPLRTARPCSVLSHARYPDLPLAATAQRSRSSQRTLLVIAALAAVLVFALAAARVAEHRPRRHTSKVALCNANLRTSTAASAKVKTVAKTGTIVTIATTITGARLHDLCGQVRLGEDLVPDQRHQRQERQGAVRRHLPVRRFRPVQDRARLEVRGLQRYLRSSEKTGSTALSKIGTDAMVTVVAVVTGRPTAPPAPASPPAGSNWAKISAVDGKSIKSLYGVSYVYVASKLLVLARPLTPPPRPAAPGTLEGLDVSHWQSAIDWLAVAAAGKTFAYMKASEDIDFVDQNYATNRAGATAAGLVRRCLSLRPADASPATRRPRPTTSSTPRSRSAATCCRSSTSSDPMACRTTVLTAWVRDYLDRIHERLGVRAVIYCSPNFWKNYMADTTWFANNGYQVLWVAHWTTAAEPTVPGGALGWQRLDVLAVHLVGSCPASPAGSTSIATTAPISARCGSTDRRPGGGGTMTAMPARRRTTLASIASSATTTACRGVGRTTEKIGPVHAYSSRPGCGRSTRAHAWGWTPTSSART